MLDPLAGRKPLSASADCHMNAQQEGLGPFLVVPLTKNNRMSASSWETSFRQFMDNTYPGLENEYNHYQEASERRNHGAQQSNKGAIPKANRPPSNSRDRHAPRQRSCGPESLSKFEADLNSASRCSTLSDDSYHSCYR